jgi:hypothetical protein
MTLDTLLNTGTPHAVDHGFTEYLTSTFITGPKALLPRAFNYFKAQPIDRIPDALGLGYAFIQGYRKKGIVNSILAGTAVAFAPELYDMFHSFFIGDNFWELNEYAQYFTNNFTQDLAAVASVYAGGRILGAGMRKLTSRKR